MPPEAYELQLERAAERALERIPASVYRRIEAAIDTLANEPRPRGTIKLRGGAPLYRIRVGDYRVVYAVFDEDRLVKILQVLKRDEQTYRNIE